MIIGDLRAGIGGQVVVQTIVVGSLRQIGFIMELIVIDLAHADVPAPDARTLHLHHGRERLRKGAFAPVCLFNGDHQLATVARWADIADLKRPRWHGGFVNFITALGDGDFCVGVGYPTNYRRIAGKLRGQHTRIAVQARAANIDGVESFTCGIGFAHNQLRSQRR